MKEQTQEPKAMIFYPDWKPKTFDQYKEDQKRFEEFFNSLMGG